MGGPGGGPYVILGERNNGQTLVAAGMVTDGRILTVSGIPCQGTWVGWQGRQ